MPEELKKMMSRQASAEREKRATITKAEGDREAAVNLAAAAKTMGESPGAMQLRTLQTIDGLGPAASNTVVIAVPVELMEVIKGLNDSLKDGYRNRMGVRGMNFTWPLAREPPTATIRKLRCGMITQNTNAGTRERFVEIPAGRRKVRGTLRIPREPQGVVAFAHGSGSGRFSPRNQFVAQKLQDAGLTTLLIDLLEEDETQDRRNVFDIELLADRLGAATHWLVQDPDTRDLRLGYFGASTGAAAALVAAAWRPESIAAVVSRGGRPDLAWDDLPDVAHPHC